MADGVTDTIHSLFGGEPRKQLKLEDGDYLSRRRQSEGGTVEQLQKMLNEQTGGHLKEDGVYGKHTGLHEASGGDVIVAGRRINGARAEDLARVGLCTIPEGRGVFPNLTVRENLWMATHRGLSLDEVEEHAFVRFPRLKERRDQAAGTLSGGEQQMLAVARAVSTTPAVLMLDELSMGLGPIIVEELYGAVAQLATEGVTILVVEQFAKAVLAVASLVAIMVHGQVVQVGTPDELEAELQAAYLGGVGESSTTPNGRGAPSRRRITR